MRWTRCGEVISPSVFIPLFEKHGQITKLDEYVMRKTCAQQREWLDAGKKILPVSVNISRASLCYRNIAEKQTGILAEYGLANSSIQLEITESSVEGKQNIIALLNKLRTIGIKILMDDFGTGYSSLSLLSSGCFDTIKLDKSLIDNIDDEKGEVLIRHIVEMAKNIGLGITAEGVENADQFAYLKEIGCDDIQGYYFSKPLDKDAFAALLENA